MSEVKVRAKDRGQKPDFSWANRGDIFSIPEDKFSDRWMEKVDKDEKPQTPMQHPAAVAIEEPTSVMASNLQEASTTDRESVIRAAIGKLIAEGSDDVPNVSAINKEVDLDPKVTAAERDAIMSKDNG